MASSPSQGFSPDEIQASFSPLSLRDAYGAILAYLERSETLDASFRKQDALFQRLRREAQNQRPAFYAEMRERVARFRETQRRGQAS